MPRAHGTVQGKPTMLWMSDTTKAAMKELSVRLGISMSAAADLSITLALQAARNGAIDARVTPDIKVDSQGLLEQLKTTLESIKTSALTADEQAQRQRARAAEEKGREVIAHFDKLRAERLRARKTGGEGGEQ